MRKIVFVCAFALVAIFALAQSRNTNPAHQSAIKYNQETDEIILQHEFRGAWVTTVSATDWPKNKVILEKISPKESNRAQRKRIKRQIDSQKVAIVEMFAKLKECGINAVMFHTISNSDAMYPSKILPWSAHLTGKQGQNPGYDPLEFVVRTAHSMDMEVHAWLNPFRIGFVNLERAENHPFKLYPDRVMVVKNTMYWNPAHPDVIKYLGDICTELMSNYDLDGIHIDDYFYPEGLRKGDVPEWDDSEFYSKYGGGMSVERWREENVNKTVKTMFEAVHKSNPDAIFSVSPGGRLVNTQALYADPQHWIEEGTIDFLAPQIYWQHGHRIADFKLVLDSWKDIMKDVACVPGLAAYRWGEKNAFERLDEYDLQIKECREASDYVYGNIWFTTGSILRPDFANYMKENFYRHLSLTPDFRKDREKRVPDAPILTQDGKSLSWRNSGSAQKYALYKLEVESYSRDRKTQTSKVVWRANLVEILHPSGKELRGGAYKVTPKENGNYAVLAIDGKDYSPLSNVVFVE